MRGMKRAIPWLLLSVRVMIVPLLVVAAGRLTDRAVLWLYVAAFATDYFDGASARYFETATPLLRRSDSTADTLFFLAVGYFIVLRHPQEFYNNAIALVIFVVSIGVWYAVHAVRWHRLAGFHAYSAKFLAAALLIWMIILLNGGRTGYLLSAILFFGTVSHVEGIAISLLLRSDRADVPTIFAALRQRRENLRGA